MLLRRWRRRVMRRATVILLPIFLLSLAGTALPGDWRWSAGFIGGAVVTMWLALRDSPPPHIQQWADGADGERRTEKVLRPLERRGWHVVHDLDGRFGNVDHFVVGAGGVFLLDSKNWGGEVTVDRGVVTVTPTDNPDAAWSLNLNDLGRKLRRVCAANSHALRELTGVRCWVHPVVVIWAPFKQRCCTLGEVTYVAGDYLFEWLEIRRPVLDEGKMARVVAVLGSAS